MRLYRLSVGDGLNGVPPSNTIDFTDGMFTDKPGFVPHPNGFSAPPPAVRRFHSRTRGTTTVAETQRLVTIKFSIFGETADDLLRRITRLERLLQRARDAAGQNGVGTPVVLWVRQFYHQTPQYNSPNWVWLDVQDGQLTQDDKEYDFAPIADFTLVLTCLPYGRSLPVTYGPSPTISGVGTYFLQNVPGDSEGLSTLTLTDQSAGIGNVINGFHIGRRAQQDMQASDFNPIVDLTPVIPTVFTYWINDAIVSGNYTLTFAGIVTAAIAQGSTAVQVQAAFTALTSVNAGNATVTGSGRQADPFVITFAGALAGAVQPDITLQNVSLVPPSSVPAPSVVFSIQRLTGTPVTDATAYNGGFVRLPAPQYWGSIALGVTPGGQYTHGTLDTWLRLRDATSVVGPPFAPTATQDRTGGTISEVTYPGLWQFALTEVDASGAETAAAIFSATLVNYGSTTTDSWLIRWVPNGTPATYNLYYAGPGQTLSSTAKITGISGSVNTYRLTAPPTTLGNVPPAGTAFTNAVVQAATAIKSPTPNYLPGQPNQANIAQSIWEYLYLSPADYPPIPRQENAIIPDWQVLLQCLAGNTGAPLVDVDHLILIPHDEPQQHVHYALWGLTTPRRWLIDCDRELRSTCVLTSIADGSPQGQATPDNEGFTIAPGNSMLVLFAEGQGGVADQANLKFTVSITVTPRYLQVTGLT